jgi:hypothetical protein
MLCVARYGLASAIAAILLVFGTSSQATTYNIDITGLPGFTAIYGCCGGYEAELSPIFQGLAGDTFNLGIVIAGADPIGKSCGLFCIVGTPAGVRAYFGADGIGLPTTSEVLNFYTVNVGLTGCSQGTCPTEYLYTLSFTVPTGDDQLMFAMDGWGFRVIPPTPLPGSLMLFGTSLAMLLLFGIGCRNRQSRGNHKQAGPVSRRQGNRARHLLRFSLMRTHQA